MPTPAEKYQAWVDGLPPASRAALARTPPGPPGPPAEDPLLPADRAAALAAARPAPPSPAFAGPPSPRPPAWILDCTEGDDGWPQRKVFDSFEKLADWVRRREGTDTVVYGSVGWPLIITRGPDRLIIAQDRSAYRLTHAGLEFIPEIPPDLEIDVQEDGFLGPPELLGGVDHFEADAETPPAEEADADDFDDFEDGPDDGDDGDGLDGQPA